MTTEEEEDEKKEEEIKETHRSYYQMRVRTISFKSG